MRGTAEGDAVRTQEAARVEVAAAAAHQAVEVVNAGVAASSGPWADRMAAHLAGKDDPGDYLPGYVDLLGGAARTMAASVEDAATAAAVLIREGLSVQLAALGAARTCLEATARAVYLYAAGEDIEEQIRRGLEIAWADHVAEGEMRRWSTERGATPPFPDSPLPVVTEALGWSVKAAGKDGRYGGLLRLDAKGTPHKEPSATALITRLGFDHAVPGWRMTSAAGHGRPWLIANEVLNPDTPTPGASASTASRVVGHSVVELAQSVAQAFAAPALEDEAARLALVFLAPAPAAMPPHHRWDK